MNFSSRKIHTPSPDFLLQTPNRLKDGRLETMTCAILIRHMIMSPVVGRSTPCGNHHCCVSMAKTRSMNRNQNHDPSSSSLSNMKKFKTCDSGDASSWSNLNHDLLLLVMMQLGVVDFLSFNKVCKSWRSLALSNKKNFISSRPPMLIWLDHYLTKINHCSLRDFNRRTFEPILPNSTRVTCYGLTCGYLIMFGNKHHDFWLVNPITGHQLHFPPCPYYTLVHPSKVKGILVFSPSVSKWVFVISYRLSTRISFCTSGKQKWNHINSTLPFLDLHAFKGKIYTMHTDCCLHEMKLNPNPNLILIETKNVPKVELRRPEFVSSGENLFVMNRSNLFKDPNANKVLEFDFGEMKWVSIEERIGEYVFFVSNYNYSAAVKRESWGWANEETQSKIYEYFRDESYLDPDKRRPKMIFYARMWYFTHDCLSVDLLNE
ncbi:hypothetical protein LXL04_035593 [Taraxacum kok-saghyz]